VAGTTDTFRRHLIDRFQQQGLRLRAAYPLVGCAGACLNGQAGKGDVVLEHQGGFLACTHLGDGGGLLDTRYAFTHEAGNPAPVCIDLVKGPVERVWLAGRWPDLAAAARQLDAALERPCAPLPVRLELPPTSQAETAWAGMKGAADHYLGRVRPNRAVGVPAQEPLPPLRQDWRFRASIALALAALALGGATVGFRAESRHTLAILDAGEELTRGEKDLAALRTRLSEQTRQADFLRRVLPERRQLIPRILGALEASCPEEVMLTAVVETAAGEIEVRGWGLTPQKIQAMKIDLQCNLADWKVVDTAKPLRQQRGWGGLPAYPFELRLVALLKKSDSPSSSGATGGLSASADPRGQRP
jgi:hypothetical protein